MTLKRLEQYFEAELLSLILAFEHMVNFGQSKSPLSIPLRELLSPRVPLGNHTQATQGWLSVRFCFPDLTLTVSL